MPKVFFIIPSLGSSLTMTMLAFLNLGSFNLLSASSFVENKEFKVESENRGSFYMEYDQTSLLVRSNCPIKIQAKNGMLKEPFYLTGGERVFKMK